MFGAVMDDEQRLKLRRVQAFMTAAEGYGDHVMHALGAQMLPSYARIDEAMRRYRETEQVDPVFERLLGIEVKREQYRLGGPSATRSSSSPTRRRWRGCGTRPRRSRRCPSSRNHACGSLAAPEPLTRPRRSSKDA